MWVVAAGGFASWRCKQVRLGCGLGLAWRCLRGVPACQMLLADVPQGGYPVGVVVEAGDVVESFATCGDEGLLRLLADFFECFKAVADKARADYIYAAYAFACELLQGGSGAGL